MGSDGDLFIIIIIIVIIIIILFITSETNCLWLEHFFETTQHNADFTPLHVNGPN